MDISKMEYNKIEELDFNSLINIRYKNWKEFCEKNNIAYKSGSYNKKQQEKLSRFCKIKWIDRELIIKDIYEKAKSNKSTQGRKGEFATPLEKLLRYLPQDRYMSMSKIMKELWLVTKDYCEYKFNQQQCVEEIMYELDKPAFGTKPFDNYCLGKIVSTFFIQSMFISENIKGKLETLAKNNIIELNVKIRIKSGDKFHYANEKEIKLIEIAESIALDFTECKNKSEVMMRGKFDEFYAYVRDILKQDNIELDMYYPAYKFTFIDEKKGRRLSKEGLLKLQFEFRQKYINRVRYNIENCTKQIEYISKSSHGDLDSDTIKSYLNSLCDFLILGKEYNKYTCAYDKDSIHEEDLLNGIPF